jgi:hypothetical protein
LYHFVLNVNVDGKINRQREAVVSLNCTAMVSALCLFPSQSVVSIWTLHNYVCLKWDILRLSVLLICFVTIETYVAI